MPQKIFLWTCVRRAAAQWLSFYAMSICVCASYSPAKSSGERASNFDSQVIRAQPMPQLFCFDSTIQELWYNTDHRRSMHTKQNNYLYSKTATKSLNYNHIYIYIEKNKTLAAKYIVRAPDTLTRTHTQRVLDERHHCECTSAHTRNPLLFFSQHTAIWENTTIIWPAGRGHTYRIYERRLFTVRRTSYTFFTHETLIFSDIFTIFRSRAQKTLWIGWIYWLCAFACVCGSKRAATTYICVCVWAVWEPPSFTYFCM